MFCFVSYADTNASTEAVDAFRAPFQNRVVAADEDAFERAFSALMNNLTARVVNGSGTSSSPAPMFATGAAVYDSGAPNGTMYGLMQCMRDRTAAECDQCLQESVRTLTSCCRGHVGGVVFAYSCYMRMEIYPYYNLALDGPPLLAPAPMIFAGGERRVQVAIMPSSLWPLLLLRLFILVMVASNLSTGTTTTPPIAFEDPTNPFTSVDCRPSSSSAAPSPSPSSKDTGNDMFQDNVNVLLGQLPSSAATTGFASLSGGEGTDRAFVRGLCRGDTKRGDCQACLVLAVLAINSRCNSSSRRAGIWYDDGSGGGVPAPMFCFVSYADTNTSTASEDAFRAPFQNVAVAADEDAFERAFSALMNNLTARVVNGSGTSSSPAPMFATGAAVYDSGAPNGTMYGLMQCMRDRTAAECDQCLQESVRTLTSCCRGHVGGVVFAYSCYMRMEIYPYYNLALDGPPLLAPAPMIFAGGERRGKKPVDVTLAIAIPVGTVVATIVFLCVFLYRRKVNRKKTPPDNCSSIEEDIGYVELDQLNLAVLRAATNNFSEENKLGEGGFGEVFKGTRTLHNGEDIAVKKLSQDSSQGFQELKNELVLAAKLKHRNLVQLLGVSLQEEKLVIYEYMPNRSLDTFLSDPVRRHQLDWSKRFTIICGIARGLLYLHEESRLKVIHRDLKPSNVLLDADMNPKISDFGIARAFSGDQSRDITRRPVGTLGYMSPEYAYWGHVSTKSDILSFGVIVLEMVTGRRNNSAYSGTSDSISVLSHVWDKWRAGSMADVVDPSLAESGYPESEVLNCIEIGLLCVQENPVDRPDASAVVLMLSSPTSTADDRRAPSGFTESDGPARSDARSSDGGVLLVSDKKSSITTVSENEMSISELQPR
ncbi:unnamed protein product [Urochloa decumbens]|uniref:Cysteine-rich receptor-like protein kinase 25 n=1 Tax=Urochloa decumbens TaxID=240449 RepID=A0ABC9BUK3_9POAL